MVTGDGMVGLVTVVALAQDRMTVNSEVSTVAPLLRVPYILKVYVYGFYVST